MQGWLQEGLAASQPHTGLAMELTCLMKPWLGLATMGSTEPKVWKEEKRQSKGGGSLFLLHFIGITFISLQKNSAHTLECSPLKKGSAPWSKLQCRGRFWGDSNQRNRLADDGRYWAAGGEKEKRFANLRRPQPWKGAPSRTKVKSLGHVC